MLTLTLALTAGTFASAWAQSNTQPSPSSQGQKPAEPSTTDGGVVLPPDYVIGPDDVLAVMFWREKEMSAEVAVRPDGNISLPLLNDVQAAGLTPDQLRERVVEAAARFVEEPNATVVVKQINSRRFFITGQVSKPGTYPLTAPMTILQALALAGGILEYAKEKDIAVFRTEDGRQVRHRFNYRDVIRGRNMRQNIELKPGDTIVVP